MSGVGRAEGGELTRSTLQSGKERASFKKEDNDEENRDESKRISPREVKSSSHFILLGDCFMRRQQGCGLTDGEIIMSKGPFYWGFSSLGLNDERGCST